MIEIMQDLPDNVIDVIYSGTVTGKDYDDVLIPVFKEKLKKILEAPLALSHKYRNFSFCLEFISGGCNGVATYTFVRESCSCFRRSLDK